MSEVDGGGDGSGGGFARGPETVQALAAAQLEARGRARANIWPINGFYCMSYFCLRQDTPDPE